MKENTESKTSLVESLVESVEEYSKTCYELFMLKAIDKLSDVVSSVVSRICAVVVLFLFIIVLHVAAGLWLGEILGKSYYGFLCVAALDAVVWIVLQFMVRNWFKKLISNSIISQLLNN
jgi:hypothetical protein